MSNTINFDNTFVAGSKWLLKSIENMKKKLHIPASTHLLGRIKRYLAPSRVGLYTLITLLSIAYMITAPLFAGPNYIVYQVQKAKAKILGKHKLIS